MTTRHQAPLVTILLPTFNRQDLLEGCLDSLCAQTYPHFRVEILDNGSTPPVTLPPRIASDPRFELLRIEDNSFRVPLILEHTRQASTRYTAYIFDDDRWEPTKLEEQITLLEARPDVVTCFTHATIIDDHGLENPTPPAPYPHIFQVRNRPRAEWVRHFFKYGNCLCAPSAVMRTDAMAKRMHRLPLKQLWDFSNWVNLLGAGNLHIIEKPLTRFRVFLSGANESAINTESLNRLNYESSRILHQFRQLPVDLLREAFPPPPDADTRLDDDVDRSLYEQAVLVGSANHFRFAAELAEHAFTQRFDAHLPDLAAEWSNRFVAATSQSRSALSIRANTGSLPPPADRSISFVICSIDNTKYAYVSARLDAICTAPHEIIRIDDARSLSEGYTRGIAKARFDTVVLCHDDIDLLCDTALTDILHSALHEFDVVGVAGPRVLKSAFWLNGGPANTVGLVVHGPVGKPDAPFVVNYYDCSDATRIPVQALDGVFIAAKKRVFDSVCFDADLFDGFHLYDIDFSYRCHLAGLRVGVAKDLALVHASPGNFGETWLRYEKRFREKYPALAPARLSPRQAPAAVYAASLAEAALVCLAPDTLLDVDTDTHPPASPADQIYSLWRRRTTMKEIDAQLLAERMVLQWKNRPGIHLLLAVSPGEETLLADTLDSLAAQLYPEWLLTIVTALPPPEGLGETPNIQWLALRDEAHINYVIDEMAAASPGTWLTRIDPGLSFEPQALQVVANYINEKPDWRLIYCDEDTLEADGSFTQPLFKPDFNLDLLRAQAYFGCFIVVAKQAFLAAGRYGDKTGAENYDLSLRILDQNGESSIGHIDQMLAHLSRNSQRAMQPEAEKLAVTDHLARCDLDTAVLDGALFGTRRIQYKWATTPKVSIIIPTRDREEYLRPLLESLFERTRYPNYEVIILDNDSRDPDTVRYLAGLVATEQKQRTRVIAFPGEFSWSGCANAGAEAAEGDYLLFLDNDIHIVQDDWLARLMSIAQRPEVAIVAPRLTYPETGRVQQGGSILGLYGTVGSPWDNQLELSDPGYMGRALCDQNVSAASGSALLVRRSAYVQLGGFDTTHFGLVHGALDLCLRTGEAGHKIVFTPHSALVHYGSVSITARQRKLEGRLTDLLAAQQANETLIHRWMPRLVHDPAYNRNLSLLEPYKPEHVAPTDWDLNFHDRPRILAIPVPGGAGEYRLRAPLRIVGQAGLAQTMICESPKAFAMRILSPVEIARAAPDALVLHQPLDDSQSDAIENYARYLPKVRRILTIDDLVTDLPKKHPLYKSGYKDGRQRLRRNLALMDRLVVSTRPLADLCVDMIEDIRVMPNCLEWAVWGDAVPPRLPRKKPRVGWAGAQQHQGDLELIYPVVEALADEVDWIFMGMCPPALKPFVHESHGFEIDFSAYPKALARLDLDLAIAPLDIHPFNEAKSNLRLLEYGAMGWPVICTDIYPYQNAPVTRLPNEPEKWIKTIREQLAEPDALREAGLTLQAWVHDSFILENHAASWFAAYGP
ncbi:MAG: glycosyltransferase [Zoogloea sp.]|nr:glycosyltransferase [Zoogloea sp.]